MTSPIQYKITAPKGTVSPYNSSRSTWDKSPLPKEPSEEDAMEELWTILEIKGPMTRDELFYYLADQIVLYRNNYPNLTFTIDLWFKVGNELVPLLDRGVHNGHFAICQICVR